MAYYLYCMSLIRSYQKLSTFLKETKPLFIVLPNSLKMHKVAIKYCQAGKNKLSGE